jgi:AraC-like DNA-binding protein
VRAEPSLSAASSREAWQALTRPLFAVTTLTPPRQFGATWTLHQLGRLVVSQVEFTAQEFVRDPDVRAMAAEDLLLLELYEAGSGRGVSGETPTFIDPGRLHLIDLSRRYRAVTTAVSTVGVVIPHAAIQYDRGRHPSYLALPLATPQGAMLAAALRTLVGQLPAVTMADAPALCDAFAGLVRSLFPLPPAGSATGTLRSPATAASIRHHIDRHLADELNAAGLARRFGMSRATLYRLFRAEGGIDAYIRARRLERCSAELMLTDPGRGRVREVAERLGFMDAGHFTRAFRQRFGVAPSDHLGVKLQAPELAVTLPQPAASTESVRLFGDWLRREAARLPDTGG